MADPVWFWQGIASPHMAGLAEALAVQGRHVVYVAEQTMSADRAAQGWQEPTFEAAHLHFAPNAGAAAKLVAEAPRNSIHVCQGLRGNTLIGFARTALGRRGLRQWVIMEAVEEHGWAASLVKRLEYHRLIRTWRSRLEGILAIGQRTPDWLVARGMPADCVYPFAYFLPDRTAAAHPPAEAPFRVLFVGQFIERKRLDLLIDALGLLDAFSFELVVIGSGRLERELRARAEERYGNRAVWLGQRPIQHIPALMAEADCLVLPSRHDGWGAVVSEALMAGTPAICSNRCGSAIAVRSSGCGGVFPAGDVEALASVLRDSMAKGRQTPSRRTALAAWAARCLSARGGAEYLSAILRYAEAGGERPLPPWEVRGKAYPSEETCGNWASRYERPRA